MGAILHAIAYNADGAIIQAADALPGEAYRCPGCNGALIPRRSTEQKKGAKRPHFAHKVRTPDCDPESVLHFGFKRLLYERIRDLIAREEPLPVQWHCTACERPHKGNLLKKAVAVIEEHDLGTCRPDIALLDAAGKAVWALEVVVTHPPEQQTLTYYRKSRIALACFKLASDQDLAKATAPVLFPDPVEQCVNPRCLRCAHFQRNTVLWVVEGACYQCACVIKVAAVEGGESRGRTYAGPDQFTPEEIRVAEEKGCMFKVQYSRTMRERYLANTCPHCNAFVGQHYLFTDYISCAGSMGLSYERVDIGYHCTHCEEVVSISENNLPDEDGLEGMIDHAGGSITQQAKEGFCIHCRTVIPRNLRRPLCATCFRKEGIRNRLQVDSEPLHCYCLRCGNQHPTTRWKPYCPACYTTAGWT